MKEKKLTDEEIVKDIERSTGMPSYWKKIVLDLIHRQKAEIERLAEEMQAYIKDYEFVKNEYVNALTTLRETNQKNAELQKQVDELTDKNMELRLNAIDLMNEISEHKNDYARLNEAYVNLNNLYQQAVKDTAKEIWKKGKHFYRQYPLSTEVGLCCLRDWIKETYGVEVE